MENYESVSKAVIANRGKMGKGEEQAFHRGGQNE